MNVHSTAIIDPRAKVPESCKVGPYCVIGADVELGGRCHLISHVTIEGPTRTLSREQVTEAYFGLRKSSRAEASQP